MELDEATKERLKNIEKEVLDHIYVDSTADGILGRDSNILESSRSDSMLNQKAAND